MHLFSKKYSNVQYRQFVLAIFLNCFYLDFSHCSAGRMDKISEHLINCKNNNLINLQLSSSKFRIRKDSSFSYSLCSFFSSFIFRSPSPEPIYGTDGKRLNTREYRMRRKLEEERHSMITKMISLNADFKPPVDYK